ncbi:hypothetical protein KIN20_029446 [Parelaphostrongylus tenuis]|uniref:Uncharacterized protein n=1 Tax=Parelaphostrongylus tenuis TaxID=148309 RepID=A0AAD5R2M4_PARTN|nr:hypothetical protein KIN20_029446 [Parelaphostrongylus tenuis]
MEAQFSEQVELGGSVIAKTTSYVYLGHSMNMEDAMKNEEKTGEAEEKARIAFEPLKEAIDQSANFKVLFDSTVLEAYRHAAETCTDTLDHVKTANNLQSARSDVL